MDLLEVGMFDPEEVPGGLDRYRVELSRALQGRGHRVGEVCARRGPGAPGGYPPGGAWQTVYGAAGAVRELRRAGTWQLVASHFALTGLGALLGTVPRRLPWVVHFHGPWAAEAAVEEGAGAGRASAWRGALRVVVERAVYARAAAVITLSRAFADLARTCYGVPRERLVAIPPGINLSRFRPGDRTAARRRLGLPAAGAVMLCVRRLARRMGLENLIDAAAQLPAGDWQLLIAGEGVLRETLQARLTARGLGPRARLLGRVPEADLPDLYRAADVFLLPSESLEGFGMVIPEALASGVPVLATPVGGIPEALQGLPAGLLPPGPAVPVLAEAMRAVLEGRASLPGPNTLRAYAQRHFSWDRTAAAVERVYGAVCGA